MTLFDVAKKNMKGNFKSYLIYFISMLFSVVIYYTFVSLQYSTEIVKGIESSEAMQSIFLVASVILILFVSVFMLYSNKTFARKRKKEVGLYSLLGLQRKTIGRMLFYENFIMGTVVLVIGIAVGTFLSRLFSMILIRLLGIAVDVGMVFSLKAVINTTIVFISIILLTSIQDYRLIYKFKLIELFRAEQVGEQEPKASVISGILAVLCLILGYWFAFQRFSDNEEVLRNIGITLVGIILGTILLFSSAVVLLLKIKKRNKKSYYNGMNLITTSNLVYRIKGNSRMLSVISLLSAVALSAVSVGVGMYYGFEENSRLATPFSYMYISQDETFNESVDNIIRGDEEHPVIAQTRISVIKSKGEASSSKILSGREANADENPVKIISVGQYNKVANILGLTALPSIENEKAIAIRPMYTDYETSDYKGETITLNLPKEDITLEFEGMTVERVINWSYPDVMIVVSDEVYNKIEAQSSTVDYVGYVVEGQKATKKTTNALAEIKTPESKLSTFYTEYRLGIEGAAFNVFILGFLGLVFIMATGSIIYFKQLSEVTSDKSRYEIINKIGVSNRDISMSILRQNAFIFGLPLVIGVAHYMAIISFLKRFFSNLAGVNLIQPIVLCVIIFSFIYAVYFGITVNSSTKIVNGKSLPVVRALVALVFIFMITLVGTLLWTTPPAEKEEPYTSEKIILELPEPTGQYDIGTTEIHLVDDTRVDSWMKDEVRELMVSIWYPAQRESEEKALYMKPGAAKHYDENTVTTIGLDPGQIDLSGIVTNAWINAPVANSDEGWPVILYSPGGTVPRNFGTAVVEDLASRGYVVVTVDHTYETSAVEFPDERVETGKLKDMNAETVLKMMDVRVDDMKYVLDQLAAIQGGKNSDHNRRELPIGLAKALNLTKVGIFGHSAGGATSAQVMYEDDRVDAGIDMDGTMGYMPDYPLPVAKYGLNRPFMLMNAGYNDDGEVDSHLTAEDRNSFWKNSTGWKLDLAIPNGAHYTFTDYQILFPQLNRKLSISPRVIQQSIGTAESNQVFEAQRNYIAAFFDLHLKDIPQPLLDSPSTLYPEVEFIK
ncbi:FtsX-like permease family protein [Schnuerera sp. xch1]|uniref:FtsX-like permease family protein n=1 Tax=Schnuerera sp. xch1 TaxID=2874283 RepID=UPI001CBC6EF3|nr:FtsX-like permease family protein [Schnuerera sp. xch1]MBZ2174327.1 FtsX-like permease family protein [Schnuerera sp. xch1]